MMLKTTKKSQLSGHLEPHECWIITEGMIGTENQCIAVAEAMGIRFTIKKIQLSFPFDKICPLLFKTAPHHAIHGIDWNEPFPDIIIASGRKAVPVTLTLQKMAKKQGKTLFTVFIQDPKINTNNFDLVAIPAHDGVNGKNVIVTTAAPTRVTSALLKEAKSNFDFSLLPSQKIAVLIGGNSKTHTMADDFANDLADKLAPYLQSTDYGFLVTVSRRTSKGQYDALRHVFSSNRCVFWDGTGTNPYHAFLANADFILVTEDSTSMLSDACTTDKPVYRLPLNGRSNKFDRLYHILAEKRGVEVFRGNLTTRIFEPLNDAQMIADAVKQYYATSHT